MRLLAICPRISHQEGKLVIRSSWRVRLLLLGLVYRRVEISPEKAKLKIFSRYLWLFSKQRILKFSQIEAITYGYEDIHPLQMLSFAHHSIDSFTVGLRLVDDSELTLFKFIGEGTFINPTGFPDWMYWEEYAFDLSGSQEGESRYLVDYLSKMMNVTVVPPRLYSS